MEFFLNTSPNFSSGSSSSSSPNHPHQHLHLLHLSIEIENNRFTHSSMDRREKAQTSEIRALFSFRSILIYFTKLWYLFLILLLIDLSLHEIQSQNHSKRLIVDGVRVNRLRNKREISNEITSPTSTSASILTTKADSIASSLNNHYTICMNYFHRFNSKHTACLGPNPQCIISQVRGFIPYRLFVCSAVCDSLF